MAKLSFIIDKEYDFNRFLEMLNSIPEKEKSHFLKAAGFEIDLQNRIEMEKILPPQKDEMYKNAMKFLKKTAKLYQSSWNEIDSYFFKKVEKITGFPWQHTKYYCVVSPFNKGISNWGGNKIVRTWSENPYYMRKITAHEVLISHIFTIFDRLNKWPNLNDQKKWVIAEISAWSITGLEEEMVKKCWPWINEENRYPYNHNYQFLVPMQKELKKYYLDKKDFISYLIKAVEVAEKENE